MSRRAVLLLVVMTSALVMVASPAWVVANPGPGATFIVNRTSDEGDNNPGNGTCATAPFQQGTEPECTLRAAIQEANAAWNEDTIVFSIGGSGVQTISPSTSLPTITQPVTIDGYTEPGASKNTLAVGDNAVLLIRLDRGSGSAENGLRIDTYLSVVRGLSITGFTNGAGLLVTGDRNTVEGNFIGTDPGGTLAGAGNFIGVSVQDYSSNNLVGGTSPGARNVISGNGRGVSINDHGSTGNKVMGNYIGTTKSGTGNLGNSGSGIFVSGYGNSIGDNDTSDGFTNAANTIAFNGTGVEVGIGVGYAVDAVGISILSNSIFSNDGPGIDLDGDGITPNDGPGDADTGPNNLQNFPVLSSAKTGRKTTVKGTLESTQGGATFTIQFFSNPKSARDEGKKLIGEKTVSDADADGVVAFTFKPARKVKEGMFVTATATYDSTGDTSEFSAPRKVRG